MTGKKLKLYFYLWTVPDSSMNIFFLSPLTRRCARWHCDKHVVKMILESTQILYTAHHVNGGTHIVETSAPICKSTGRRGFKKHAAKHPSVLWASEALPHYMWLCQMALYLCEEHQHRFSPTPQHSCTEHLLWLQNTPPPDLRDCLNWLRDPPCAMPDQYKVGPEAWDSYRAYYRGAKKEKGLFKWSRRHIPHVFL